MMIVRRLRQTFLFTALAAAVFGQAGCAKPQKGASPAPANPVEVAVAIAKDMPYLISSIGQVQAYSTVSVKAQVGGEVVGVHFKEGQDVRRGDVLLSIDRRPFEVAVKQAESQVEKDRALLRNAEADLARYSNLVRKDYVTKEQYDSLVAGRDVLIAAVKADEAAVDNARLELGYCTIASPIDGRTGSILIHRGNVIKANDLPAVVILQVSPVYVTFSVPERHLPRIKEYMSKGELEAEVLPAGGNGPTEAGRLTFVDNAIDATTGAILLKATFANHDRALWPGQFLNVRLTLFIEKNAVVVPARAVLTSQSDQYVFVVRPDLTVETRTVKVDRTAGEEAVIAEGLKAGETVVTDGQIRLIPGARVAVHEPK